MLLPVEATNKIKKKSQIFIWSINYTETILFKISNINNKKYQTKLKEKHKQMKISDYFLIFQKFIHEKTMSKHTRAQLAYITKDKDYKSMLPIKIKRVMFFPKISHFSTHSIFFLHILLKIP